MDAHNINKQIKEERYETFDEYDEMIDNRNSREDYEVFPNSDVDVAMSSGNYPW